MDGNFEAGGGGSGGSSSSGPADMGGFNSSGELGSSSPINSSGPNMTHMDYLKDGVDKGYYKAETEGIFSLDEVMSDAQDEMSLPEDKSEWDIMDIPGTAHEKLEKLANMSDVDIDKVGKPEDSLDIKNEQENSIELSGEPEKDELSFEEKVIMLQSETMKLLAEALNSKANKKDIEELMKKLQEVIEEAEKEKDGKKATLLMGLFSAVLILLRVGDEGYKKLENEVKEVQK